MAACGLYRSTSHLGLPFLSAALTWNSLGVLLSLSLVTCTSMVVNDYFDARSGADAVNLEAGATLLDKPLADGTVPLPMAKKFVSVLYSILLTLVCILPQRPVRLAVTGSTILTFLYTNQIKPFTFWKNLSVSAVIAATPFVGGCLALHGRGLTLGVWSSLLPMVAAVFLGVLHREVLMDVLDVSGDASAGVRTLPVVYGVRRAAAAAAGAAVGLLAVVAGACWGRWRAGEAGAWKAGVGVVGAGVTLLRCLKVLALAATVEKEKAERLPSLWNWSVKDDGGITGNVSGSSLYDDGSIVSTSPVTGEVSNGQVVVTESGTYYILEDGEWDGDLDAFGAGNGGPAGKCQDEEAMNKAAATAIEEAQIPLIMILLSLA